MVTEFISGGISAGAVGGGILVAFIYLSRSWIESQFSKSAISHELSEAERVRRSRERWDQKKNACMKALKVVDASLSYIEWRDMNGPQQKRYPLLRSSRMGIDEIRETYNDLVTSCENGEVVAEFLRILFAPKNPADLWELRRAVREELGHEALHYEDKNWAFIGCLECAKEYDKGKMDQYIATGKHYQDQRSE